MHSEIVIFIEKAKTKGCEKMDSQRMLSEIVTFTDKIAEHAERRMHELGEEHAEFDIAVQIYRDMLVVRDDARRMAQYMIDGDI